MTTGNGTDWSIQGNAVIVYHQQEESPLWLSKEDLEEMLTRLNGKSTDDLIPYIGDREQENKLMLLAEEAGGSRIAENIVQMTNQDLERFLYFVKEEDVND